jgi:hypothetical protein
MSDTWAERFNPNHAPAGSATGGQFAPSGGAKSSSKPGAKSSHDTRPAPTNAHPVGTGEHGKRVSDLQSRLNALGFKPPLKVDGIFGPKTLAAVRAFQKSHGLKVDGLVGPKTTAALRTRHPAAKHAPAHTAPHPAVHTAPKKSAPAPKPVHRDAADTAAGHAYYLLRSRELRAAAGLDW